MCTPSQKTNRFFGRRRRGNSRFIIFAWVENANQTNHSEENVVGLQKKYQK